MKISETVEGYFLRSIAIIFFGLEVVFLKYTSLREVSSLMQTFLYSLGIFFSSIIFLYFYRKIFLRNKKYFSYKEIVIKIPKDKYFFIIIVGNLSTAVLMATSLKIVESTTFIIINNLSPVFTLVLGILFYKNNIILKSKKSIMLMLCIFLISSIGSIIVSVGSESIKIGSMFGLGVSILTMVIESITIFSVMKYAEVTETDEGSVFTGLVFLLISILMLPFVFFEILNISFDSFFWGIFTGFLSGIAFILFYPISKRINKFLAYLLLNFAALVTFGAEYYLGGIAFSYYLVVGAILIAFSSIFAEMQNIKLKEIEEEKQKNEQKK